MIRSAPGQARLRRGGARLGYLPAVLLIVAGCTGEADPLPTSASLTSSTTSTTSTTVVATTTTSEVTTTVPVDPVVTVGESLAASSSNYRFTSLILVGEQTLTTIEGVVDGNSVAAAIGTGTGEVSYIRTPDGEWVTGADGEWVALEGAPPVAPPLGALVDAGDLALVSGNGTTGVFTGVLGPAAGAAQGLPFTLTVEAGLVTEIRYEVDTGGELAQVITTLSEIGSAGSVIAPEGV
ncbi:MAG TPA: hypothetical protein VGC03_04905 [Acidimicrobiia bacterium]